MPSQRERQEFLWRPNDNSVTTRTRYDLEAEHWVRAFKSATRPKATFTGSMSVIGLIFSLIFSILNVLVLVVINFIKWLKN
ncbi:hypothetical protein [Winogradskyella sp. A2]|uniref:hypothetical protein n=1 Tax=Winogradskyella sp. A2 TaxID=3366944 RepID=UPI00398C4488